jgi:hypothetical protein
VEVVILGAFVKWSALLSLIITCLIRVLNTKLYSHLVCGISSEKAHLVSDDYSLCGELLLLLGLWCKNLYSFSLELSTFTGFLVFS